MALKILGTPTQIKELSPDLKVVANSPEAAQAIEASAGQLEEEEEKDAKEAG